MNPCSFFPKSVPMIFGVPKGTGGLFAVTSHYIIGCYSGYDNDFLKRVFDFGLYVRIDENFRKRTKIKIIKKVSGFHHF